MEISKELERITLNSFENQALFIVDIAISEGNGPKRVKILLDSDKGLKIDECAAVSRKIAAEIEKRELINNKFILEVSSPGVDYPLKLLRQFKKNIGRKLKVNLNDGRELQGILKKVEEKCISLLQDTKSKGKKKEISDTEISFTDIKKTIVLVSFK